MEDSEGDMMNTHILAHILEETSTDKFIDVVAPTKEEAIRLVGKRGVYKETSARRSNKQWGVYVFRRK